MVEIRLHIEHGGSPSNTSIEGSGYKSIKGGPISYRLRGVAVCVDARSLDALQRQSGVRLDDPRGFYLATEV
jgi:hypothetical protein